MYKLISNIYITVNIQRNTCMIYYDTVTQILEQAIIYKQQAF